MGVVYEALDRERNSRVALKTLRTLDATAVLRFKNEFRWLQDLQHPNLVSLGELFSEDGQWFFTMELIDGVDFLHWVRPPAATPHGLQGRVSLAHGGDEPTEQKHLESLGRTLTPKEGRALHALATMP